MNSIDRWASVQVSPAFRNVSWYLATVATAQPESPRWTKTTSLGQLIASGVSGEPQPPVTLMPVPQSS